MVDSPSDAEGETLAAALVSLGKSGGAVGPEALVAALAEAAAGLDDLALDVPKAAGRLGALVGEAAVRLDDEEGGSSSGG